MDEQTIYRVTGIFPSKRQKLIRYYARMHEPDRISVHAAQSVLMRSHREGWQHSQESLAYCMLIKALGERYPLEHVSTLRDADGADLSKAQKMWVASTKSKRGTTRKAEKASQIINQLPLIKTLLEEELLSWREIARLLAERMNISVSHSHLKSVYEKNSQTLSPAPVRLPALPHVSLGAPGAESPPDEP